jgi:hypothetical protein
MHLRLKNKRPMMLVEVLIAFALIVTAVLPLLTPHLFMLKAQTEFIQKVQLDHDVNLLYGEVLQRLYLNRIPWTDLQDSTFMIDPDMLHRAGIDPAQFRFQGTYRFKELRCKSKRDAPYSLGLYQLMFRFLPKNPSKTKPPKPLEYEYKVFVVHDTTAPGVSG